ncbi:MAG: late competence development ComFB family protein [Treponema sp.]|nr:late competence development ComFB family protein [Treponema sp.]
MDIHNLYEDIVFELVQKIFDGIESSGNPDNYCLCYQCRIDTTCFTLNRIDPHYIVSNRGFSRIDHTGLKHQQIEADITSLVYKGLRLVNHNLRPTSPHDGSQQAISRANHPIFDIPTISGRIFNGASFEPVTGIEVSLYHEGELIGMRNSNWQNPFKMISSTPGFFSFWPAPINAVAPEVTQEFKFSLRIHSPDYETLNHFFNLSVTSKFHNARSYALNRTFKLPDLYLFPPGDPEMNDF